MKNYRVFNALFIIVICTSLIFIFYANSHAMLKVVAGFLAVLCIVLLFNMRKSLFATAQFVSNHFEDKEITYYMRCLKYGLLPLMTLHLIAVLLKNTLLNHNTTIDIIIIIVLLLIILVGVYMITRLLINTKSFAYHELNKTKEDNNSSQESTSDSKSEKSLELSLPNAPLKKLFPSDDFVRYLLFVRLIEQMFFNYKMVNNIRSKWYDLWICLIGSKPGSFRTTYKNGLHQVDKDLLILLRRPLRKKGTKNIHNYKDYCRYSDIMISTLKVFGFNLNESLLSEFRLLIVLYLYYFEMNEDETPKIPDDLNDENVKNSLYEKLAKIY